MDDIPFHSIAVLKASMGEWSVSLKRERYDNKELVVEIKFDGVSGLEFIISIACPVLSFRESEPRLILFRRSRVVFAGVRLIFNDSITSPTLIKDKVMSYVPSEDIVQSKFLTLASNPSAFPLVFYSVFCYFA